MNPRLLLIIVNLLGGVAVLASYVQGTSSPHATHGGIWGGVPEAIRGGYTVCMFAAAAGYFPFTWLFAFGCDPTRTRFGGRSLHLVTFFYGLVLVPSALWLPLTTAYLDAPSDGGWIAILTVLALAALGSLGLLRCLLQMTPRPTGRVRPIAITGCLAFCFQTVVLDAIVWTLLFPR